MTGAVKMRERSALRACSAATRAWGDEATRECPAQPVTTSSAARGTARLVTPLLQGVERLRDGIERGGLDPGAAGIALSPREGVAVVPRERDPLLLLTILVLDGHRQLGRLEAGRRASLRER